jgi:transcription-repair coupling factor (superfamily II helicase)
MHVRDWVRTLSPPALVPGRTEWNLLCAEAMAPMLAASWLNLPEERRRFFIVTSDYDRALQWQARLALFGVPPAFIRHLPSGQSGLFDDAPPERFALSERAAALNALAGGDPVIILATPQASLERGMSIESFRQHSINLHVGDELDLEVLLHHLDSLGYEREEPARLPGGYSRRGGIVDVFAAGSEMPTRIELFGSTIESLRSFDPDSQRSIRPIDALTVPPLRSVDAAKSPAALERIRDEAQALEGKLSEDQFKALIEAIDADSVPLSKGIFFDRLDSYLPFIEKEVNCALDFIESGIVFLEEPVELKIRAERAREDVDQLLSHRFERGESLQMTADGFLAPVDRLASSACTVELTAQDGTGIDLGYSSLVSYRGRADAIARAIDSWVKSGVKIVVATDQPTRARSVLEGISVPVIEPSDEMTLEDVAGTGAILIKGNPAGGFINSKEKFALLTDAELFGVGKLRLPQKRFNEGSPIASVLDLKPGDYVVHIQFGIGRYRGLVTREVEGVQKEFLHIQYQSPDQLFVPTDQLDRVQKYLSPGDTTPQLHRITGGDWHRTLRNAKKGAEDLARDLIRIYAKRASVTRAPFGEDTPWQAEMEATFQWVETPSQLRTIEEIKKDLNEHRPMDRLVCGDVGFGKTEVAIRAAFKVAQAGKQVAVLCPTTVLADQHYETFKERLAAYPLRIHVLSRFRSAKERKATIEALKTGEVDIVIGTHALLQSGVEFKNLGLVIVDEEQRFGVKHKERLKDLRAQADFLTLTATPIPRTLSMALMNVRELSVITDPPPGRLPIRTYVRNYGDPLVREAILRELSRGGQVYYVFNRIEGIHHVASRIQKLAPNARIAVAHGQMKADELEPIMIAFFHGEIDILVCTTIIENGIDNPNANTLIVEGADRLGLSQLYQLRGRVGRSDRQAYAYLLYRGEKNMTENAIERLKALQEFSELGSGYSLALRDLQIRGAGELLGSKQHGLMATVGYDMYCHLINQAVQQLRNAVELGGESAARLTKVEMQTHAEEGFVELPTFEIPAEAYLPKEFIPDQSQRLFLYKRLMECRDEESIRSVEEELRDRFGVLPSPAEAAVRAVRLRLLAKKLGVRKVEGREGRLMLWLEKGRELPLRAVHALQREHKGLRFRNDLVEWRYRNDALESTREALEVLRSARESKQAVRA